MNAEFNDVPDCCKRATQEARHDATRAVSGLVTAWVMFAGKENRARSIGEVLNTVKILRFASAADVFALLNGEVMRLTKAGELRLDNEWVRYDEAEDATTLSHVRMFVDVVRYSLYLKQQAEAKAE